MQHIYNRKTELEKRRRLRAAVTGEEKILWPKLRNRKLKGLKFRRQYSIGPYIVDFYCPKAKLAIEIDGRVHNLEIAQEYDREREKYIGLTGIYILRFSNDEIRGDLDRVLIEIGKAVKDSSPTPPPSVLRTSPPW